jgi:hypothetical protein
MMCLWASYKKKIGFFCILKINENNCRIRGSGSALKCHGSPILSSVLNKSIVTGCAGAGTAGVPQLWAAVGGGDTDGAATPAQDQVCRRAQALRARSLRPARCLQVCISVLFSVADPNPDPRDPYVFGRLQIRLSSSKNSKKHIDSYCFVTSV